jgi:Ni,Fe-hydrogenase III large subunit
MATHINGNVAARVTVRFEEVHESMRLMRLLDQLPTGELRTTVGDARCRS